MFVTYNYFRQYNNEKEIKNHKEFYKKFSNTREFGGGFTNYDHLVQNRFHNTLNYVYNAVLRREPHNILDIGCGNGVNLPISGLFPQIKYCAIDYAEKAVENAKKTYPTVEFKVGDAFALPYENNSFDMAILSSVLILYKSEKDRIALINEAKRVLNKDGVLIIILWNDTFMIRNSIRFSRFIGKIKKEHIPQDFMGCHFTKGEAVHMIRETGMDVKQVIKTSSLYGILESVRYLNMSKYRRNFGKGEATTGKLKNQNVIKDLQWQCKGGVGSRMLVRLFIAIERCFPNAFAWTGIYLCEKK